MVLGTMIINFTVSIVAGGYDACERTLSSYRVTGRTSGRRK